MGKVCPLKLNSMNFFRGLVTSGSGLSSKRFAGLCLIGVAIIATIYSFITGVLPEPVESLIKTNLYTGSGLLGVGVAEGMLKTVARPKPVPQGESDEGTN